jgi:hypothetical protein
MPNLAFAGGFLNSFIDTQLEERKRQETNTRDMINFMVSTGRVRDYNDLLPMLGSLFPGLQQGQGKGKGGGGGSGKSGAQGQPDPNSMLAQWLNPAFKMDQEARQRKATEGQTAGQPVTSGAGQPGQQRPPGLFLTEDEVQSRATAAEQSKSNITEGARTRELGVEHGYRQQEIAQTQAGELARTREANRGKYGPGTLQGRVEAEVDRFRAQNGRDPTDEEYPGLIDAAREKWQGAGKKVDLQEQFTKSWMADASKDGPLTPGQEKLERLRARKAWQMNSGSETPDQKLSRAEALAKFRDSLDDATPADIKELSQRVSIGDHTIDYVDTSPYRGGKIAKASKTAIESGVVPVTGKQSEVLVSAQAAGKDLTDFLDQIKSKLAPDAAGRPLTSITNTLEKYFQTDDVLAAASAWDTTLIPQLRAIAASGLGRITNREIDLAIASRPKLSDTVAVAAQKVANVQSILWRGIEPIVTRGQAAGASGAPPAQGSGQAGPSPPAGNGDAARRMRARHRIVTNGFEGTDANIDTYLKNHPDFK